MNAALQVTEELHFTCLYDFCIGLFYNPCVETYIHRHGAFYIHISYLHIMPHAAAHKDNLFRSQSLSLSHTLIDKRTHTYTDLYDPETALSPSINMNLCPICPLTLVEARV